MSDAKRPMYTDDPESLETMLVQILATPAEPILEDGDLIVSVVNTTSSEINNLCVSSAVLKIASPEFAALMAISEAAREHNVVPVATNRPLNVGMRCILSLLHHTNTDEYETIDAQQLSNIATCREIHEKIAADCNADACDIGAFLLAATNFKTDAEVVKMSKLACLKLPATFVEMWSNDEDLAQIPQTLVAKLTNDMQASLGAITKALFSFEELAKARGAYDTRQQLCLGCGRRPPAKAKKCNPCHNLDLLPDVCTTASRIGNYFLALQRHGLWPPTVLFKEEISPSDIINRIEEMARDTKHTCNGEGRCPLVICLEKLPQTINVAVAALDEM
ncbi:hypothetical protein CkaCkLH20_06634 [Colletotrichum karsti]|uniref:BTB domain-containing protein n=1 Tax=Colletotrichum karsti TaxID=1095194 RepID=A0A9P6LKK9_9PEZI|nr:uncharacterized protein CkaCkLH20_06634 [Colletotrichum karsti]KAF9875702.1 hypothetical protein CkaCkLH20_06634 [Colletotrichum karsti]